jgi:hypothetical protein
MKKSLTLVLHWIYRLAIRLKNRLKQPLNSIDAIALVVIFLMPVVLIILVFEVGYAWNRPSLSSLTEASRIVVMDWQFQQEVYLQAFASMWLVLLFSVILRVNPRYLGIFILILVGLFAGYSWWMFTDGWRSIPIVFERQFGKAWLN